MKLAPLYDKLKDDCAHTIIHTGQHYDYELSQIFFEDFELPKPTYNLEIGSGSQSYQVAEMIKGIELLLDKNRYDMAIVYGDTNSTFAGAFAAVNSNLPVAHVEAGLRSYDRRMPEEINRILTDNLSNLLFASTNTAAMNLQKENIFGQVIKTGDLSVEVINHFSQKSTKSDIMSILGLAKKSYILFTMHRAENTIMKESLISIIKVFTQLQEFTIVFPMHPRTKNILKNYNLYNLILDCKNVKVINPVGYTDFVSLMKNASKIVTDSGGVQKEAYLLSVPCITIRKNTEWIETIEEGWNILTDTNTDLIVKYVKSWLPINTNIKPIFGNGTTSELIRNEIMKSLE
jgi:UDP-N-acetylglucosamine 2-epimerase (non-hydrolysing)